MEEKDIDSKQPGGLSPEEYQHMEEQEKDREITRSLLRLQSKIQNILYLTDKMTSAKEAVKEPDSREERIPDDKTDG